ncbi:DUF4870 domain-containing protein [Agromyces sp. CFH 90414]|uniref:DUF4870 domain-containing protein n=1 Tax=Agromyces agglutinans TaxID=2662258 RepID=A0A6I2FFV5_9MICO|nr:DUF4870 domain-containing protein [Agromyces agglutinans]MRG61560.1 DUF4870 domain-containing protein [Agromyces agglutinans]
MSDAAPPTPPPGPPTPPPPGPPTPPPGNPYQQSQQLSPSDEKLWATLIHIGGAIFNFLPALIGYLVLKDKGPFIRAHSATALNFQLTVLIAYVVSYILMFVLIGFFLFAAVWIVNIVFSIIAAVKANQGQPYTYPMSIKFVS